MSVPTALHLLLACPCDDTGHLSLCHFSSSTYPLLCTQTLTTTTMGTGNKNKQRSPWEGGGGQTSNKKIKKGHQRQCKKENREVPLRTGCEESLKKIQTTRGKKRKLSHVHVHIAAHHTTAALGERGEVPLPATHEDHSVHTQEGSRCASGGGVRVHGAGLGDAGSSGRGQPPSRGAAAVRGTGDEALP